MVVPPGKAAGKARWQDVCGFVGMFFQVFLGMSGAGIGWMGAPSPLQLPGNEAQVGMWGGWNGERALCVWFKLLFFFFLLETFFDLNDL